MADLEKIAEDLSNLTVLEAADLSKLLEEIMAIVRTRRSFGMVLHAKGGNFPMSQAGNRVVVQVAVRDFKMVRE